MEAAERRGRRLHANGGDMSLALLTDDEALEFIEADGFEERWKLLHAGCPWATGCQHPDFVVPWYAFYAEKFRPVILVEHGPDGTLTGLMTLGLARDGRQLTGAGAHQAEYHGWVCDPAVIAGFAPKTIRRLRQTYPLAKIFLKYLCPGMPVDWAATLEEEGELFAMRRHGRPVMKVDPAGMELQRRKKVHRQNYNRLARTGAVRFERVGEHEEFLAIFDDICLQYDFRQSALRGSTPFLDDRSKKPFYLELHRRGILHATVLRVDDDVAASHIGVVSKNRTVHLGINTYAPAYAAHSPGHLLLAMLGIQLAGDGFEALDLTPGGDGYKEQFASEHDDVHELTIFPNAMDRLTARTASGVRGLVKAGLRAGGYRTTSVLSAIEKLKRFGQPDLSILYEKLRHGARSSARMRYHSRGIAHRAADGLQVSKNRLDHVLKYDGVGLSTSRIEFPGHVMRRMERSGQFYSVATDDILLAFCWANPGSGNSLVLSDLYAHRNASSRLIQGFIEGLVTELGLTGPGREIYYEGYLRPGIRALARNCGFMDEAAPETVDPALAHTANTTTGGHQ